MNYFSHRNKCVVEFSGHEEVSDKLRARLKIILNEYVGHNNAIYHGDSPYCIPIKAFSFEIQQRFPGEDFSLILQNGSYDKVFTVVEVFVDFAANLQHARRGKSFVDVVNAFILSGSIYTINRGRVELCIEKDLAEKLEEAKEILSPYDKWYRSFFEAVGNLVGRKAKPQDIVKDIFISTEGYLKELTKKSKYGDAVSKLHTDGTLNREQKAVMDKLNAYCSDAEGARHAGSSKTPNETDALWFLETILAQLRNIHRLKQKYDQQT